jgi:hypothetical protein
LDDFLRPAADLREPFADLRTAEAFRVPLAAFRPPLAAFRELPFALRGADAALRAVFFFRGLEVLVDPIGAALPESSVPAFIASFAAAAVSGIMTSSFG